MHKHHPISVCTWSLQCDIKELTPIIADLGLQNVHLDLCPALEGNAEEFKTFVKAQPWGITATMVGFPQEDYTTLDTIKVSGGIAPDDCWEKNCQRVLDAIKITAGLGVKYLTTHIGFIDHSDPAYAAKFYERVKLLANAAEKAGIMLLLESGQESASELKDFLEELGHPAVGVNFDPANMILYGKGDPIDAVYILAPWIKHVHIKDAIASETPGTWGSEVPWSTGQVDADGFLDALDKNNYHGAVAIEREAGDQRVADIKLAIEALIS
ncbi:MAG: sugar phosphate isomerase/epimerase [Phycisphaerae bacterium]|nr:sugar phosphate isomerase/epimerase [Phycisphaerae bacterium]